MGGALPEFPGAVITLANAEMVAGFRSEEFHEGVRHIVKSGALVLQANVSAEAFATLITKTAAAWGSIPRHYIKCLRDHAMVPALAQKAIDMADLEAPTNKTAFYIG